MDIPYLELFQKIGREQNIGWTLLAAQCWRETNFNPRAVSETGAMGIAQFMPATWEEWGEGNPYNPEDSIRAQARYLKWLIEQMRGDVWWALVCYNYGIDKVIKLREGGGTSFHIPEKVWGYVETILEKRWEIIDDFASG
jgi:membrane-bound lytic murein transglycosylase MltF